MRKVAKETKVEDKLVQERITVLKTDREFRALCRLVPKVLRGRESGKDFHGVTDDIELFERNKGNGTILLSKDDMRRYEEFARRCDKLAERYGLHWATVEDLAMGVKQPVVRPRLGRTITGGLDPIVLFPKDFDPNTRYVARSTVVPPLAAMEIMRRVQQLKDKTKEEIEAYLFSLFGDIRGCRLVELVELSEQTKTLQREDVKFEIDVCLKVPPGYTGKDVAEVYQRIDSRRKQLLYCLGTPVPERRRQSKLLMKAKALQLLKRNANSYDIADDLFPYASNDWNQDRAVTKAIRNKRYKANILMKKHLQHKVPSPRGGFIFDVVRAGLRGDSNEQRAN